MIDTPKASNNFEFQLTAARRRLGPMFSVNIPNINSFNSQPPEGGWVESAARMAGFLGFQLTAARRRLGAMGCKGVFVKMFQLTAARRRLAT